MDALEEIAALGGALFFDELAARQNDVLADEIDLEDLEIVGLAHVLIEVLGWLHVDVRGRHERIDADGDNEAAFDLGLHAASRDGAFGEFGEDVIPVFLLFGLVVGKDGVAVLVFEFFDQHFDAGADLKFTDVDEFISRDEAFGFAADVDDNFILADLSDRAGDDRADLQFIEGGLREQVIH